MGFGHIACLKSPTHLARREMQAGLITEDWFLDNLHAALPAITDIIVEALAAISAETMIIANDKQADMALAIKKILYELTRREQADLLGELHEETGIQARSGQFLHPPFKAVNQQQVVVRLNQLARMVDKGHNGRFQATPSRLITQMTQEKLVATMNSIEESDAGCEITGDIVEIPINCHF